MENALKERDTILTDLLPTLFKTSQTPSKALIKLICQHQALAAVPQKISNPKAVKVSITAIFDQYTSQVNVVDVEMAQKCPLTHGKIQTPWLSTCGHTFEESTIIDYMKVDKYCPIHGCNKKLVKKNNK
ncbi:hypothetical protein GINT2_001588 [Glugoides intestinalis]